MVVYEGQLEVIEQNGGNQQRGVEEEEEDIEEYVLVKK